VNPYWSLDYVKWDSNISFGIFNFNVSNVKNLKINLIRFKFTKVEWETPE